ncbi:MAG TPA: biotin-dependent carboxyltransferase family protein [Nocardioidaceae bacterium]|nr:biotin-dependent carboxyltransferase family protein [Nocardioidaceae bacterium]
MTVKVSVLGAGPLTTVQDRGRRGFAHLGVPRSGALDVEAALYANRLVGNPSDAAVLETTLGGVTFRVSGHTTVAVTGAPASVTVDGRPRAFAEPMAVGPGQTVVVGPAVSGLRSYVAFSGGVDAPRVLGSRSTDTLSGIGPPRLETGTELLLGDPTGDPHGVDVPVVLRYSDSVRLRVVPGPRVDWFAEDVLGRMTEATYTVSSHSNRVGVRLEGPSLPRRRSEELPSEGLVLGAIQVPSSGQPLVFLNDHPTTGGYPVVGVVAPEDIAACAQLRPGTAVRLVV